jgi:hypothetical protein
MLAAGSLFSGQWADAGGVPMKVEKLCFGAARGSQLGAVTEMTHSNGDCGSFYAITLNAVEGTPKDASCRFRCIQSFVAGSRIPL